MHYTHGGIGLGKKISSAEAEKENGNHITSPEISFEVIVLFVFGIMMLLFGALLFKIHTGELPYTPDSTYGLFLVIVSLQIIALGRTPFGDFKRSWILIILGIFTAAIGMTACFIPGYLSNMVRILAGLLLFTGGIALLLQLFISKEKAKIWINVSGVLRHLTLSSALVYFLSAVLGFITLFPLFTTDTLTAVMLLIYGLSYFYLAVCIHKTNIKYKKEIQEIKISDENSEFKRKSGVFSEAEIPLSVAVIIPVGFLLLLLGFLLFPVSTGLIPFSPDGQLGLLMVVMAIQMLALGETPAGQFQRSWLLMIIGVVFATIGIFSCLVPGILTGILQELIGALNITGGIILLLKRFGPAISAGIKGRRSKERSEPLPPVLKNLVIIQTVLNFVSIGFGASMFMPGIVPGEVIAAILIINGILIFALASLVFKIDKIQKSGAF